MNFVLILVALLAFMYFLLIRPQQKQKRRTQDMLSQLGPGDEVITIGGIYGDVVEVHGEKVVLEIAEDVHIEVTRRAIANIVPPEAEEAGEAGEVDEAEEEDEEEGGEEAGEEPAAEVAATEGEKRAT